MELVSNLWAIYNPIQSETHVFYELLLELLLLLELDGKQHFATHNQEPKAAIDIIAYIYRIAHTES